MTTRSIAVGDALPSREFRADTVQLFLYNAAIWNPHRIHYDLPYTQAEEGHPQLLIDGPLQGDWLTQIVCDWLGDDGDMTGFRYSNRRAAYLGDVLMAQAQVTAVDGMTATVTLTLSNTQGEVATEATATVRFRP